MATKTGKAEKLRKRSHGRTSTNHIMQKPRLTNTAVAAKGDSISSMAAHAAGTFRDMVTRMSIEGNRQTQLQSCCEYGSDRNRPIAVIVRLCPVSDRPSEH